MTKTPESIARLIVFTVSIYAAAVFGSMAMMSIAAAWVFVVWLWVWFKSRNQQLELVSFRLWSVQPLFWPTIAIIVTGAASLIRAQFWPEPYYEVVPEIHFLKDMAKSWHIIFIAPLAQLLMLLDAHQKKKVLKVWFVAALVVGVLGCVQYYVPLIKPQIIPQFLEIRDSLGAVGRYFGGRFHANGLSGFHLSYVSILTFPTAMAWVLWVKRRNLKWFVGCAILSAATIFSYSKMAWIALPVMVLFILNEALRGKKKALFLAGLILFCGAASRTDAFRLRWASQQTWIDRINIWEANVDMAKKFPLFGVGWHHNSDLTEKYYQAHYRHGFISHAHNNFLDQLSTTGLVGLAAYLWWTVVSLYILFKIYKNSNMFIFRAFGLAMLAGWCGLHLNGLTQANWWDAKVLHQISFVTAVSLALVVGASRATKS